jgi:hypothetical protein
VEVTASASAPVTGLGYIVRHVAERHGLSMWTHEETSERIADAVLSAAVNGGQAVTMTAHLAEREQAETRARNILSRACAAEIERDRMLGRVQAALSALEDRALARETVGVLLLPHEQISSP